jgi:hypothetical protein
VRRRARRPAPRDGANLDALAITATRVGQVPGGKRLLEFGLVAASTLAVADRFREVGMAAWRVALPTANAPGRVATLGVVRGGRRRVAGHTVLDVGGGPRGGFRIRPRRPRHQEAADGPEPKKGNEEASGTNERHRGHGVERAVAEIRMDRFDVYSVGDRVVHGRGWSLMKAQRVGMIDDSTDRRPRSETAVGALTTTRSGRTRPRQCHEPRR